MRLRHHVTTRPPAHLTVFGRWLWWRLPVIGWRYNGFSCEGASGLMSRRGRVFIGASWNGYHHFWPQHRAIHAWRIRYRFFGLSFLADKLTQHGLWLLKMGGRA